MIRRTLVTLAVLAGFAVPARAQVLGLPVVNNGSPTGINIGADVGFANDDYFGGGTGAGAHASVGLGFFGVTAMISHFSPKNGDGVWSPGGSAMLRLLGGPLVPFRVTMQAGVGRWSFGDVTYTHVPLSLGIAATIPNPALAIKPWIAPRIDILHSSETSVIHPGDVHFGISGGIDFALLNGVSIRVAYDRVSSDGVHPSIFSLGLGLAP